jgi:predicted dehydrogenase
MPDVEVAGVCDIDPCRLERVREEFGVDRLTTDYSELLGRVPLDLVSIATMPVSHRELAIAALESGANVICEKPLAMNASEGREMVEKASQCGRFFTLGCNMRHMGSAAFLKRFVDEGRLGRPLYTRAWSKYTEIPWWGKHYVKAVAGGGVVAADAVHVLDVALWVAGHPEAVAVSASVTRAFPQKRASTAPSAEAAASYDVEDLASAHIRFVDGSWMTLELGWGWNRIESSYSFEIVGELSTIELDPMRVTAESNGRPIDVTPSGIADNDWARSIERGIEDAVDAVRNGGEPLVRADEALAVQRIVDAVYRSAEAGREVSVE